MAEKSSVLQIFSQIALPLVLAAFTGIFQLSQNKIQDNQNAILASQAAIEEMKRQDEIAARCMDLEFKLYEIGCDDQQCKLTDNNLDMLKIMKAHLSQCKEGEAERIDAWILNKANKSNDPDLIAKAIAATDPILQVPQAAKDAAAPDSIASLVMNARPGPGKATVVVVTRSPLSATDKARVFDWFKFMLNNQTPGHARILFEVSSEPIGKTEFRCVQQCAVAQNFAKYTLRDRQLAADVTDYSENPAYAGFKPFDTFFILMVSDKDLPQLSSWQAPVPGG